MREIVVNHWLVSTLKINRDFYKYPVSLRVVKGELKPTIVTKKIKIMAVERTLTILKPDCVRKNLIGEVTRRIQEAGFKIVAMKMTRLTKDTAGGFYAVHKERPFFGELVEFMSSGACVPMILEKENAIADFRKFIGATNPAEAEEGTIRADFADSVGENIVHGSDSVENGKIEAAYFFAESEVVANQA
jgi:nucleoside-diphosphate kinase